MDDAPTVSKAVRFIHQYFDRKKKGKKYNRRSDLMPADLAPYLPCFTILDLIRPAVGAASSEKDTAYSMQDGRFRLVGTRVAVLYGEATGKSVAEHHGEEILARVKKATEFCMQQQCNAICRSVALAEDRPSLDVTLLYIPFSADDELVDQFLVFADIQRVELQDI